MSSSVVLGARYSVHQAVLKVSPSFSSSDDCALLGVGRALWKCEKSALAVPSGKGTISSWSLRWGDPDCAGEMGIVSEEVDEVAARPVDANDADAEKKPLMSSDDRRAVQKVSKGSS